MNKRSKNIDTQILMVTKLTQGQIPQGTLSQIARMNNVSREWVRLRANKLNVVSVREITQGGLTYCIICKTEIRSKNGNKKYCSPKCYKEYRFKTYWTTIKCKTCGKEKSWYKKSVRIPTYCSKQCLFKDIGTKGGGKPRWKTLQV